jgi:hypothetical protein
MNEFFILFFHFVYLFVGGEKMGKENDIHALAQVTPE